MNAHRHLPAAGPCRHLHAGVRPHRRDGDAVAGIRREQHPGAHQARDRAAADADHPAAAPRRLSGRPDLDDAARRADGARDRHRHRARRHRARHAVGAGGRGFGDRPAARPWLRHRGRSDPGPAGPADRQLPHHSRHDAAVRHRQPSSRHRGAERELPDFLAGRTDAERRRRRACDARICHRLQDRHAALGAVPGVRPRLQYRPWRAGAADAGRCRSISSACRCRSWSAS